jgi:hypothetical protein
MLKEFKKYTAGVIGLGRIGFSWDDSHYNAYKNHPRIGKVVTCDIEKKADYKDYLEMVKEEHLDIVSVCTPPETHCEIVCGIAPHVRGIYLEKPIATTLKDADNIIYASRLYGIKLQVNHQRYWNKPVFTFSRGVINSGTHAFSTIDYYFKNPKGIDVVYIDTDEPIFKLEFPAEPHVPPQAIDELIDCIEYNKESRSSGEEARRALLKCLTMLKT